MAIIIEAFLGKADVFDCPVQPYHVKEFQRLWQEYDSDADGFIELKDLDALLVAMARSEDASQLVLLSAKDLEDANKRARHIAKL